MHYDLPTNDEDDVDEVAHDLADDAYAFASSPFHQLTNTKLTTTNIDVFSTSLPYRMQLVTQLSNKFKYFVQIQTHARQLCVFYRARVDKLYL